MIQCDDIKEAIFKFKDVSASRSLGPLTGISTEDTSRFTTLSCVICLCMLVYLLNHIHEIVRK